MMAKKQSNIGTSTIKSSYFYNALPDILSFSQNDVRIGELFHSIIVIREYPIYTNKHGILMELGRMEGVNIRMFIRGLSENESKNIIRNSQRKNNMLRQAKDMKTKIDGDMNDLDLSNMLISMREKGQSMSYLSLFIDIFSDNLENLHDTFDKVTFILNSNDISYSRLSFRQEDAFLSSIYFGYNHFNNDYARVLPCVSISNLYPFSYFGKYDRHGFYIGNDEFGGDIIDDISLNDSDKTNSNVIVLGNSGQGKSYLLKLLSCNILESGKNVIIFDPEDEYDILTKNLHGESISFSNDSICINPLEFFIENGSEYDYKGHVAFLLNFFNISCELNSEDLSILESIIHKLYSKFGIYESSLKKDYSFPNLSNIYDILDEEYQNYDEKSSSLFTKSNLSKLCISLYPICKGIYSKYFNGKHFNLSSHMTRFCLKDILNLKGNIKEGILYNILSYTENVLLNHGNTTLVIDELYLFLENRICIESIRACMKRVRKRDSLLVLATQNIQDLLLPNICEYTKPLLAIPQRKFLFSPGNVDKEKYEDLLSITDVEYSHIQNAKRGRCIYKCGNETYILHVHAPDYKEKIF